MSIGFSSNLYRPAAEGPKDLIRGEPVETQNGFGDTVRDITLDGYAIPILADGRFQSGSPEDRNFVPTYDNIPLLNGVNQMLPH